MSTTMSHPFHILDVSQHPIASSMGALGTFLGLGLMMHGIVGGGATLLVCGLVLVLSATIW